MTHVVVKASDCSQDSDGNLVTEASTIGLKPGIWPYILKAEIGHDFVRINKVLDDRDALISVKYAQGKTILTVFND
jgi:hypothetical protein